VNIATFLFWGGIYHLAWALFDALWPILWNWKKTLEPLDDLQRILPYLLSRGIVVLYLGIAYLSLFKPAELLNTSIGRDILVFVSALWIARFGLQLWYFGLLGKANRLNIDKDLYRMPFRNLSTQTYANAFLPIFAFGIACYLIPLISVFRA
jgi:hypothetical protein